MHLNPQGEQMADESMIRTLAAQIEAIWPQEKSLINFYRLPRNARVLDVGAGTGEFSARIAARLPEAQVLGVELLAASVEHARERHAALAPRLQFETGDAFHLAQPDNTFDLVANRHMVQSVPHVERILAELVRVTKPGGHVHVLAEDYSMLHMMSGPLDPDVFWRKGPVEFSMRTGTDSRIGRRAWTLLREAGTHRRARGLCRRRHAARAAPRVRRHHHGVARWLCRCAGDAEFPADAGPPALQRNHREHTESGSLRGLARADCFRRET